MYELCIAVSLVIVGVFLFNRLGRKKVFLIRIRPEGVQVIKGTVPTTLIQDCEHIIRNQRIQGDIWGMWEKNELRLHFSDSLDESFRQRFRNIFSLHSHHM
ncbi:MAG: DUF3634 family protein [Desulfomonilia bacterium]